MNAENKSREIYGTSFRDALDQWEGDPRSAIGSNAIGRATSTNEGGWVEPRDIGYSAPKMEDENVVVITTVPAQQKDVFVHKNEYLPAVNNAQVQEIKRADGSTIKIRVPRSL